RPQTAVVEATRRAYSEGYRRMDTYTPFPVEGLAEELHFRCARVPLIVLLGGVAGCLGGYFLQFWIAAIYWPVNIGGRPLHSWPMFIPVTFELTVLVAALSAGVWGVGGGWFSRTYHPPFSPPPLSPRSPAPFFLL